MNNGNQNSQFEYLLGLSEQMLHDLYYGSRAMIGRARYLDRSSTMWDCMSRDIQYLRDRVAQEGIQGFLMITLPSLDKWLVNCLSTGFTSTPIGFAPYRKQGFPQFLWPFWATLDWCQKRFAKDGGDTEAQLVAEQILRKLRTFLSAFYKFEVKPSTSQLAEGLTAFVERDICVGGWSKDWTMHRQHLLVDMALTAEEIFKIGEQTQFDPTDIIPGHGPGAVATGEKLEEKWDFTHFYPDLHAAYPYYLYMYGMRENGRAIHLAAEAQQYRWMKREEQPASKLVFVPKDSRGPRAICVEPLEYQFIQQGLSKKLVRALETHPLTAGRINFTDQSVNQSLALLSSVSGEWATIDLKDASDMVSLELVKSVIPSEIMPYLLATRTPRVKLLDGSFHDLNKYAAMGSAMCFPVEALVFWLCCVAAIRLSREAPSESSPSLAAPTPEVFVYGDDIIVKTEHLETCIRGLQALGLVVNASKTYGSGYFKESCGVDAWRGVMCTPLRLKKPLGRGPSEAQAHVAWCAYAANLAEIGMYNAAVWALKHVEDVLGPIPVFAHQCGLLGPVSADLVSHITSVGREELGLKPLSPQTRWNPSLQSFEVRSWVVRPKTRLTSLESWERLCRDILAPVQDCDPSEVVVPNATKICKTWMVVPSVVSA